MNRACQCESRSRGEFSRRELLWRLGGGLGGIALTSLLAQEGLLGDDRSATHSGLVGLHHPPKAQRVIQLFMNGGASQMDTFDYKPELQARHGQQVDFGLKAAATSTPGAVMQCPFPWRQHGQSGRWVSSVFPHLAGHVDDLTFLFSMTSKTNVHGPASYLMNTGFLMPGFPCLGAWLSYGLGRLTDDLPAFVVLPDSRGLPYNNAGNFTSAFLPMTHAGTLLRPSNPTPIADLFPPASAAHITPQSEADGQALLAQLNRAHLAERPGDSRLESRIESYEMAARLQSSAPEVLSLADETAQTLTAYGLDDERTRDFGRNCLIARRLVERGVRFVQVWSGMGGASKNWDNHSDIPHELPFIATSVDQPMATLLADLKARGLLEDTLVVWSTEFGRMPFTQGATGRDHNGGAGCAWLAGAGLKPGIAYGASDEFSYKAAENPVAVYDLHATILHLLGIDHTRLTFRHNGIDRRLTDVHGHVLREILA